MELLTARLLRELVLELVLLNHKISSGEICLDTGVAHGVMPRRGIEGNVRGSDTCRIKLADGILVKRTTLEVLAVGGNHDDSGTEAIDIETHRNCQSIATATVIVLLHADIPTISDKLICGLVIKDDGEIAVTSSIVLGLSTGEVLKSDLVIAKGDLVKGVSHF